MIFSKQEERTQEGKSNDYHQGDFLQFFKTWLRDISKEVYGDTLKDTRR